MLTYRHFKRVFEKNKKPSRQKQRSGLFIAASLLILLILVSCTRTVQTGTREGKSSGSKLGYIAFTGTDGNIYVLNPVKGKTYQLTDDASPDRANRREYRYPSWSFDGEMLAFVGYQADSAGNIKSTLYISDIKGSAHTSLLTTGETAPFYLYWSPDSRSISFLSTLYGANDLLLQVLPATGGAPSFIDMGQPFYWSWSADSSTILTHSGGSLAEQPEKAAIKLFNLTAKGNAGTTLNYFPAFFQAPAYSPDGNRLLIAAEMLQRHSTLVMAHNDGEPEDLLVDWQGTLTFSWSPDGHRIAYVTGRRSPIGGSIGTLNILNMGKNAERSNYQVRSSNVLAFFWSPDSTKIVYFEPRVFTAEDDRELLVLAVSVLNVEDGTVQPLTIIRPTRAFLGQVIPFYDQYQRSHTIWSPDSRQIVVNSITEDNRPGIYAVSMEGDGSPRFLAYGIFPFWSWQ